MAKNGCGDNKCLEAAKAVIKTAAPDCILEYLGELNFSNDGISAALSKICSEEYDDPTSAGYLAFRSKVCNTAASLVAPSVIRLTGGQLEGCMTQKIKTNPITLKPDGFYSASATEVMREVFLGRFASALGTIKTICKQISVVGTNSCENIDLDPECFGGIFGWIGYKLKCFPNKYWANDPNIQYGDEGLTWKDDTTALNISAICTIFDLEWEELLPNPDLPCVGELVVDLWNNYGEFRWIYSFKNQQEKTDAYKNAAKTVINKYKGLVTAGMAIFESVAKTAAKNESKAIKELQTHISKLGNTPNELPLAATVAYLTWLGEANFQTAACGSKHSGLWSVPNGTIWKVTDEVARCINTLMETIPNIPKDQWATAKKTFTNLQLGLPPIGGPLDDDIEEKEKYVATIIQDLLRASDIAPDPTTNPNGFSGKQCSKAEVEINSLICDQTACTITYKFPPAAIWFDNQGVALCKASKVYAVMESIVKILNLTRLPCGKSPLQNIVYSWTANTNDAAESIGFDGCFYMYPNTVFNPKPPPAPTAPTAYPKDCNTYPDVVGQPQRYDFLLDIVLIIAMWNSYFKITPLEKAFNRFKGKMNALLKTIDDCPVGLESTRVNDVCKLQRKV